MATPVARSLFNDGKASLRLIRASLFRPSNANAVKDQSLLAPPSGVVILGQCQFQNPSHTDLNRQVKVSVPHLFGRSSLVGGEYWRGSVRKHCLKAEDELQMRRRKEISEEEEEDEDDVGSDTEDAGDVGDFDVADFDDDDGDEDDDDDDDDNDDVDVPRKRRK